MKSSSLTQAMVVCRKELVDWSRDRRSIITLLVSSLLAPVMIGFMFNSLASRQRQVEDVTVPVVGAAHAPALVEWLRQQPGITIVDGPADAEEAVRTRREDVIVVIPENFAKQFAASKPAQIRLVADSSSQNARPKVQRVRALFQRYSSEIGSLRLIARGVSPVVAAPVQVEDVEVSSAQQRAAMILGFIPLFVMITAFTGAMQIATDSTAGERERGSIEALLVHPAPRGAIAAGKWIAGTATALLAVLFTGGLLFALFQYIPLQDLGL
ncbi:MAG: ABC transporter permease, partial [Acidobacteriota bacterium]|nr:ABC transporter permease [Acidobacteriota bacterium]